MIIHTLTLGAYQTNCYVLENGKQCVAIDPGYEPQTILSFIEARDLTLAGILLTHGHFDHVGAVEPLVEATGCALWMSESDWSQFPNPVNAYFYPLANCDFTEVQFCEDGEQISLGGLVFTVLATPGHTHGSVCYLCEDAMFSGDTLFAGSIGRTDFPGSDPRQMASSLACLSRLEKDYRIFPGHGESTTFAQEKKYNPYLKGML